MSELKPNAELAWRALDAAKANPDHFDMNLWAATPDQSGSVGLDDLQGSQCGTTACLAGWVVAVSGYRATRGGVVLNGDGTEWHYDLQSFAATLLGITFSESEELFFAENETVEHVTARIFGPRPCGDADA